MASSCIKTYGNMGKMFLTLTEYVPPSVAIPEGLNDETDPGGYQRHDIREQIKARRQVVERMKEMKPQMYSTIWQQLSLDSEQAVKKDIIQQARTQYTEDLQEYLQYQEAIAALIVEFGDIDHIPEARKIDEVDEPELHGDLTTWNMFEVNSNPLDLLLSIQRTHLAYSTEFRAGDKAKAREDYSRLRQFPTESVTEFRERTEACLEALRATGEPVPPDDALAADFIRRLHGRFDTFKAHLENNSHQGIPYPDNLEQAYLLASQYKVVKESVSANSTVTTVLLTADRLPLATKPNKKKGFKTKSTNPPKPCIVCGKPHWLSDCPVVSRAKQMTEDSATEEIANISVLTASYEAILDANAIGIDTLSSIHIFGTKSLLENIRKNHNKIMVSGVNKSAEAIMPQYVADCKPFGTVYYDPRVAANILSYGLLAKDFHVRSVGDSIMVTVEKFDYVFQRRNNIYVLENHVAFISLSNRELTKAEEARDLIEALGFPSFDSVIDTMNNGGFINCNITAEDMRRAKQLFGRSVPDLKGKLTAPKPTIYRSDNHIGNSATTEVVLQLDIMNIGGINILIGVAMPLGATLSEALVSKSNACITQAIDKMIKKLAARNFVVSSILSDGERALSHPTLKHEVVPPGTHVPIVERKIRTIKERCRAVVNSLSYHLPKRLLSHLVTFVVTRINMLLTSSVHVNQSNITPREKYYGRKTDIKRDVSIAFGRYVQAYNPNNNKINSMAERSHGGISLYPSGDTNGSIYVYNLSTGKIVLRNKFVEVPITSEVKSMIEKIDSVHVGINDILSASELESEVVTADGNIFPNHIPVDDVDNMTPQTREIVDEQMSVDGGDTSDGDELVTSGGQEQVPISELEYLDPPIIDQDPPIIEGLPIISDSSIIEQELSPDDIQPKSEEQIQPTSTHRYNLRTNPKPSTKYAFHISLREALDRYPVQALDAARAEVKNILEYNVFTPVDPASKFKTIPTFLQLTEKIRPDGKFDKIKGRFIAGGHQQDQRVFEVEDKSSPTVNTNLLLTVLAIAAAERRAITTVDIGAAYLEANIKGDVYINIEPRTAQLFVDVDPSLSKFLGKSGNVKAKLNKALYGCVQSAKDWNVHLTKTLEGIGFMPNPYDRCIFNKNIMDDQVTIACHVDDIIITARQQMSIDKVVEELSKKFKTIKVTRGNHHNFLGFVLDVHEAGIDIRMKSYIEKVIESFGQPISVAASPAGTDLFSIGGELLEIEDKERFHTMVAKCLYLAHRTRPDILLTTNFLATRVQEPTKSDMHKLIRLLKYLQGSKDLALRFHPRNRSVNSIEAYIDASFAVHSDAKSRTGTCIFVAGCLVNAKSAKQKLVTKDSTEAELVGASDDVGEVIKIRNFMCEQGINMKSATLYQDNMSTIAMIRKGEPSGKRNRHINVRYFFLKDKEVLRDIIIKHVPTERMTADVLTKPLQGDIFLSHRRAMMNED